MAIVQPIGTGQIDRVEGSGASMVILIAMIILFGGAAYFTGRLVWQSRNDYRYRRVFCRCYRALRARAA